MAFFPNSSGFIINGGNFTSYQTEDAASDATQVLGKRKRQDSECDSFPRHRRRILDSDGLMILKAGDVELRRELISDGNNSYRIHAASHEGRLTVVKTFEGPRAKQDWKVNVAFSKECFHPNVLQIEGISDESSKNHFIQFHGITSEQKMQWLIANALGTDLNTSVQLSMKAVKGIAAGLSYIKSQRIPVMYAGTTNNNQKWDNFDILTGYDNEPIIAFHLSSTQAEDGSVSQNLDIKTDSRGVEVLNGLCDQLFSGAHSILYDDSPERKFDVYDSEGLPAATLEHEGSSSNLSEDETISNSSNSMENPKPSRKPRREVWWLDLGATNNSLESIGRCFEDRLNWSLLSSSNSLLRRIRSPKDDNLRRNLHQCPGYLREEITLTCDLSKSVIVSHAFPGLSERCSICHQLVQYTYSESFDHNDFISDCPSPTTSSSLLPPPTEGELAYDHFAPVGGINPFPPNIGVKSSDVSSVMSELLQPSLPFNPDMQSMQSMTDPNIYQDTSVPGMLSMDFDHKTPSPEFSFDSSLNHMNSGLDYFQYPPPSPTLGISVGLPHSASSMDFSSSSSMNAMNEYTYSSSSAFSPPSPPRSFSPLGIHVSPPTFTYNNAGELSSDGMPTAAKHREIRGSPPVPYPGPQSPPLLSALSKNDRPAKFPPKIVRFSSIANTRQQEASWYRSLSFRKKNRLVIDPVNEASSTSATNVLSSDSMSTGHASRGSGTHSPPSVPYAATVRRSHRFNPIAVPPAFDAARLAVTLMPRRAAAAAASVTIANMVASKNGGPPYMPHRFNPIAVPANRTSAKAAAHNRRPSRSNDDSEDDNEFNFGPTTAGGSDSVPRDSAGKLSSDGMPTGRPSRGSGTHSPPSMRYLVPRSHRFNPIAVPANRTSAKAAAHNRRPSRSNDDSEDDNEFNLGSTTAGGGDSDRDSAGEPSDDMLTGRASRGSGTRSPSVPYTATVPRSHHFNAIAVPPASTSSALMSRRAAAAAASVTIANMVASENGTAYMPRHFNPIAVPANRTSTKVAAHKRRPRRSNNDSDDDDEEFNLRPTTAGGGDSVPRNSRRETVRKQRIESERRRDRDKLREGYARLLARLRV